MLDWALTAAIVVATIGSITYLGGQPNQRLRSPHVYQPVLFAPLPIKPPGTAGILSQYVVELGRRVKDLPDRSHESKDQGYLDYVPNKTMTQGLKERISAVIALSEADIKQVRSRVFRTLDIVDTEQIDISPTMVVKLYGSPSMQIQELSTPEQLIRPGDPTVWNWDVLPTESGDADLYLVISTRALSSGGLPGAKDQPPRVRKIKVRVNPAYQINKFIKDNLPTITGLLAILVGVLTLRPLWSWLRKKWRWGVKRLGRFRTSALKWLKRRRHVAEPKVE